MKIDIQQLSKSFDATRVLKEINLDIREGELCALLGPSGSGKTTLLRIIAGLDFPDSGAVLFEGENVIRRNARDRQVGFVFQHYALFRHMTVFDNVAFGLRIRPRATRPASAQIRNTVGELLDLVQLAGYGQRFPDQLSGGQRQRVALARALAIQPRVLLLDEPFGALDARVRKEMRKWLRELQQKIRLTSVFVTHDQDEALELADRVAVMELGSLVQVGPPHEVYDRPQSPFVYDFLGGANKVACRVRGGKLIVGDHPLAAFAAPDDDNATLYVRAHDFEILPSTSADGLPAIITDIVLTGGTAHITARLADCADVTIELPRWSLEESYIVPGSVVHLKPRRFGVFGPSAGAQTEVRGTQRQGSDAPVRHEHLTLSQIAPTA
ncbi:MAG: sulfate/molybdate ABC transporter ATP-binding protein [Steroidobacteraceae bacterium]